jgi:predicted RNA-binding protein with PUA-like domain
MNYWLMKSEPEEFSIADLKRVKQEPWSGVRNYQARNYMMKDMRIGDIVFFYHSNCDVPGIVGLAKVATETYPDPTQFDKKSDYFDKASTKEKPRWWLVDVVYEKTFDAIISLDMLRQHSDALGDFPLLQKGTRLSVVPVTNAQAKYLLKLAK